MKPAKANAKVKPAKKVKTGKKAKFTNLLSVPSPDADESFVNLADWVEIKALLDNDGKASQEDLSRALSRAYSMVTQKAKTLAGDVFKELTDRETSCPGYPFKLNLPGNLLSLRKKISSQSRLGKLYAFLLVATRADMDSRRKLNGLDPTTIFEQLCAEILLNFWGGKTNQSNALVFGTARKKAHHNSSFESNIEYLCEVLREGLGMKQGANQPGAGDGKLDIVVWRVFSDGRAGGLIGFGQCKTGIHWKTHLTKLVPRAFCAKYFQRPLIIDPIRVYMVPHRVDGSHWDDHSGEGGLLMDRCRIVEYGQNISAAVFDSCKQWLEAALNRQGTRRFTL